MAGTFNKINKVTQAFLEELVGTQNSVMFMQAHFEILKELKIYAAVKTQESQKSSNFSVFVHVHVHNWKLLKTMSSYFFLAHYMTLTMCKNMNSNLK